MRTLVTLLLSVLPILAQTAAPEPINSAAQTVTGFVELGAASKDQIVGGVGAAVSVGAGQSVFGMLATQSGANIVQNSQVLIGVESEYPGKTIKGYKVTPFSIVAYGASISSLSTITIKPPTSLALSAATVTSIATGAGLAQQYAGGVKTTLKNGLIVGLGFLGDKTQSGWSAYPFAFVGKRF